MRILPVIVVVVVISKQKKSQLLVLTLSLEFDKNLKSLWLVVCLRLNNTSLARLGTLAHGQEVPCVPRKV